MTFPNMKSFGVFLMFFLLSPPSTDILDQFVVVIHVIISFRSFQLPVSNMKIELCSYSGYKIYPGHGKRIVKVDGRVFQFLNGKCEASHKMKRNPREINWTVLYRRKHKKGNLEEIAKKRTRRTTKFTRAQKSNCAEKCPLYKDCCRRYYGHSFFRIYRMCRGK